MKSYVSPGAALADVLKQLDLSQEDFALILDKPARLVSEVVNGRRSLTSAIARNIALALKAIAEAGFVVENSKMLEATYWVQLQYEFDLTKEISGDDSGVSLRSQLYKVAPVRELKSRGFISNGRNAEDLRSEVFSLVGAKDFGDLEKLVCAEVGGVSNFRKTGDVGHDYLGFWILLAKRLVLANPKSIRTYNKEKVLEIAGKANEYSLLKDGVNKILADFNDAGLTVKIFPSFSKTKVDGAATFINEKSPMIVLSMRYDRIDNFFFTLLHEVGHIVFEHAKNKTCFDDLSNPTVSTMETEADEFAQKNLKTLDLDKIKSFDFNRTSIDKLSRERLVDPGILVGALQHRKKLEYWNYREYLVKVKHLLDPKFSLTA